LPPLDQHVKRTGVTRFLIEGKRQPKNIEKPKAIGDQNMVKQLKQVRVGDRGAVLTNGVEQDRVRVPVVGNQIAQQLEHATC
jgi:methyl coenzyme M reductase subunit D